MSSTASAMVEEAVLLYDGGGLRIKGSAIVENESRSNGAPVVSANDGFRVGGSLDDVSSSHLHMKFRIGIAARCRGSNRGSRLDASISSVCVLCPMFVTHLKTSSSPSFALSDSCFAPALGSVQSCSPSSASGKLVPLPLEDLGAPLCRGARQ